MNLLAQIRAWWRAIARRTRVHREVETELQFHMDAYVEDLLRNGVEKEEAQRKARLELGKVETQNERYREAIGLRIFDEIGGDVRFALRTIWKQPAFAAVAILSLALGIGATTAMFSLIYVVLLHPFPYADSERIMNPIVINELNPRELRWFAMTKPQFQTLRQAKSIESLLGFRNVNLEVTGNELPEDVAAIYLTENAGSFFAVPALLGRGIQLSDAQGGGQPIVVLNFRFWQRHFHGDPEVIGRTLQLDHANYTIVGVMPRSFAFNDTLGVGDIYLPRTLLHDSTNPPIQWPYTPWIKLKADVSTASADAELGAMVHQFAKEFPERYPKQFHVQLQPIIVPFEQNTGRTLALLLAGVSLLLIIGCVNCSILLLARGAARQNELAVRSALGASRSRIIRQLLIESQVVSFTGAVLGVAASWWLAKLPFELSPGSFPSESFIRVNLPILGFSVGLALVSGILCGLAPALRLSRRDLAHPMQSSPQRIASRGNKRRIHILIAGQIALTLLLMATAGTAMGAFLHLMRAPLGYDPKNVMQVGIVMHWNNPGDWSRIQSRADRAAFIEQVRQRIAYVPGVLSVAVATDATPPNFGRDETFETMGESSEQLQQARIYGVGQQYFSTLRIGLLSGRIWDRAENMSGDSVAVVNESFAQLYWPHGNAIGQQIRIPGLKPVGSLVATSSDSTGWRAIIGVVGDARNNGVDMPVLPAIYVPYTTLMAPYAQFDIRTQGEPLSLLQTIRAAVASVSSDQQVANDAYDLQEAIDRDAQWSKQRLFSVLFGAFSTMALLLALAGLFSVVSYSVGQRTMEFGVRLALGAPRSHILWMAARAAVLSVVLGLTVGSVADILAGHLLRAWMDSRGSGPLYLPEASVLLAVCALVASMLAARRTASAKPTEALRYE
jgi:predicted permease